MTDVARVLPCCVSDGVTGVLWGPLQPHHSLWPAHLLQLGAQTALQEHLLLLPSAHIQAEGSEAALHRWETYHSDLQIHSHLQLWRVQLNSDQQHLEPSEQPVVVLVKYCQLSHTLWRLSSLKHTVHHIWLAAFKLRLVWDVQASTCVLCSQQVILDFPSRCSSSIHPYTHLWLLQNIRRQTTITTHIHTWGQFKVGTSPIS